jgi:hypothetical protein
MSIVVCLQARRKLRIETIEQRSLVSQTLAFERELLLQCTVLLADFEKHIIIFFLLIFDCSNSID